MRTLFAVALALVLVAGAGCRSDVPADGTAVAVPAAPVERLFPQPPADDCPDGT